MESRKPSHQDYFCAEVSSSGTPSMQRDGSYYHDALITFKVEGCLFRVSRSVLEAESEVFSGMFSLPFVTSANGEEDSDENHVCLDNFNISKQAFRDLLQILYPKTLQFPQRDGWDGWSKDRLLAVLELAHMWVFEKVKASLIAKLDSEPWQSSVDKILAAHRYEIKEWYLPAYLDLAKRCASITIKEAEKLGLPFAMRMAQVREGVRLRRERDAQNALQMLRAERPPPTSNRPCCVHCSRRTASTTFPFTPTPTPFGFGSTTAPSAPTATPSGSSTDPVRNRYNATDSDDALVRDIKNTFKVV